MGTSGKHVECIFNVSISSVEQYHTNSGDILFKICKINFNAKAQVYHSKARTLMRNRKLLGSWGSAAIETKGPATLYRIT